jgi:hypothetical protein
MNSMNSTTTMTTPSEIAGELSLCTDSSGTLILPGEALGSDTMAAAFKKYLVDGTLVVYNAEIHPPTETDVTVTGDGGGRFSGLTVMAVFTPTDGDIDVVVSGVAGADNWVFPMAFRSLGGGVYDNVPVAPGGSLQLRTLPTDGAPAGMSFQGSLLIQGVLAGAIPFLNPSGTAGTPALAAPVPVSGTVDVVSSIPKFSFLAPVTQGMTVGTLKALDFTLKLASDPYTYNCPVGSDPNDDGGDNDGSGETVPTETQDAYVALSTTLSFSAKGQPETVTTEMRFGEAALASLVTTVSGNLGVVLEDFAAWAGGNLWAGMPSPALFNPADYLQLVALNFNIALDSGELSSFDLVLSTTTDWVIIPNLITVTEITQTLTSMAPAAKAAITGMLSGKVYLGDQGSIARIVLGGTLPDFTLWGELEAGCEVDVSALVLYLIPTAQGIPSIRLIYFEFGCQPSPPAYSISASFETDWVLDVSPFQMAVTSAWVKLAYGPPTGEAGGGTPSTTGTIGGTISFDISGSDPIVFDVLYTMPGQFSVQGRIERLSLLQAIPRLANMEMALPKNFNLTFTDCSVAICDGSSGDSGSLEFQLTATVEELGSVSFEAMEVGSQWGYAAGLDMGDVSLAKVPGLEALAPFDQYFAFKELMLVVSTASFSDFVFPGSSTPRAITQGIYAYAVIDLDSRQELSLLRNFLKLSIELSITLHVTEDVVGSSLSASMGGVVEGMTITGTFGATMSEDLLALTLYMSGTLETTLQGQPITFNFRLSFVPNGAYLSGGYDGTINFVIVQLTNLQVEIGIDWEGIPTIGFGATIDTADLDSSVMVLLDSTDPNLSMFVASLSDITLGTCVRNLCNIADVQSVPAEIMSTLDQIGLEGTQEFHLDDTGGALSSALNNRDVQAVTTAFAAAGITLASDPLSVIISVNTANQLWHVTNTASNGTTTQSVLHYRLAKEEGQDSIRGTVDPQLYAVPAPTHLGSTSLSPGYSTSGALDLFGFKAELDVTIVPTLGLTIEAAFSRISFTVGGYTVFSLTSADGTTGPWLSVCSYLDATHTPHISATGSVNLLGVIALSVQMNFSASGGEFQSAASVSDVAQYTFGGGYTDQNQLRMWANGSANVRVKTDLDFGELGHVQFDAGVGYSYSVDVSDSPSASASGNFEFGRASFSIPAFPLPLDTASLASLPEDAIGQVKDQLYAFLQDSAQWLTWLGKYIFGIDPLNAEAVGQLLESYYHATYDAIASETSQILQYGSDQVAKALQGAGATADETVAVLEKTFNQTAAEAEAVVSEVFGTHFDLVEVPHVDTGTPATHMDEGVPHADSGSHSDSRTHDDTNLGFHVDTHPHWDAGAHWDTPSTHVDTPLTPATHVDTPAVHTDIG